MAHALKKHFEKTKHSVLIIAQDSYYRDFSELSFSERSKINFDHPSAFDWELFVNHIKELKLNRSVEMPEYDYQRHQRHIKSYAVSSADILIIEGMLTLYHPEVRNLADLSVFVDYNDDLRFIRRLKRDLLERGRSVDSIIFQYRKTVRPMYQKFIVPQKKSASLIVQGIHIRKQVEMIISKALPGL
jgi:uridine kinase